MDRYDEEELKKAADPNVTGIWSLSKFITKSKKKMTRKKIVKKLLKALIKHLHGNATLSISCLNFQNLFTNSKTSYKELIWNLTGCL